jgi:two-component system NtrC family response regulator
MNASGFTISEDFSEALMNYDWPGNVRELNNTLDLVCSQAGPGATLFARHLPAHIRSAGIRLRLSGSKPAPDTSRSDLNSLPFKQYMDRMKLTYLQNLLSGTRGDIAECCRRSELSRSQIYRLMQQYGLKKD